jgi:SAM-dependent methyltransferase
MNPSEAKARVARTYDTAADHFDHPALSFWQLFGEQSAARAALKPGERVLDVCCGSGASALPAARSVGPTGSVVGIDLADSLLQLARAKSADLTNVEFRHADFETADLPGASFDAVLCVFGLFFFPDMPRALRKMRGMLKPGGRMVITTWGPGLFEPMNTVFWNAVRTERPDLYKSFNPWDTLTDPHLVRRVFEDAGVPVDDVVAHRHQHSINGIEDWWAIVLGSGYRATVEQLSDEARERVRIACSRFATTAPVQANAVYATGRN